MSKLVLPFVESMIIRPCNLSCKGCSTFSDLKLTGYTTWEQGRAWLEPWTKRLEIQGWGVMGGEPLMHPNINQWILGVRELLPQAQIRFNTNGILLERHWDLVEMMSQLGNCVLKISVHLDDPRIQRMIDRIKQHWDWEPVYEFGIHRWKLKNDFKFQVTQSTLFYKTFRGDYSNMAPFDNVPAKAFGTCNQQTCPMLFKDRLYKCTTTALTADMLERQGRPNWELWQPYLHTGLTADCSHQDLKAFIDNFGKPNAVCRQCPIETDADAQVNHRATVVFK